MTEPYDVGPGGPYLTSKETAGQLRVSIRTISRYIADGAFPGARKPKARWLIPQTEVTAFLDSLRP